MLKIFANVTSRKEKAAILSDCWIFKKHLTLQKIEELTSLKVTALLRAKGALFNNFKLDNRHV